MGQEGVFLGLVLYLGPNLFSKKVLHHLFVSGEVNSPLGDFQLLLENIY